MNKKNKEHTLLYNFIIFVLLLEIVFFVFFKSNDISHIFSVLSKVNVSYVFLGIICTFLFILCEAINIRRVLNVLGYKKSIFTYLKYSSIGFFFSAITPSSSGGQPMQIYYMNKDGINISHGTLSLLVQLASYQTITMILGTISIIFKFKFLGNLNFIFIIFLILGFIINLLLTILYILAIFKKEIIIKIGDFIVKILSKLKLKKIDSIKEKLYSELNKFQESSNFIKNNKTIIFKSLFTVLIQIIANYSIPFLIFKSFGLAGDSYISFIFLQSILFLSVSIVPIPGSIGASESGFLSIYSLLFPKNILGSAMILSRGIGFYLYVLLTGLLVIINNLMVIKRRD